MKATALLAILSTIAAAEEHGMEMENLVIDVIEGIDRDESTKFYTYEHHLGQPAMHDDIEDGK